MTGWSALGLFRTRTVRFPELARGELEREATDARSARRAAAGAGVGVMVMLAIAGAFEPSRAGVLAFCAGCAAAGGFRARGVIALARSGGVAAVAFYVTLVLVDAASHAWDWVAAR